MIHLGAHPWAVHGTDILPRDDWRYADRLARNGDRSALMICWGNSGNNNSPAIFQRLSDYGYQEVGLRLYHGHGRLPDPGAYLNEHTPMLEAALNWPMRVYVKPVNEPDLELLDMSEPGMLADWYVRFYTLCRERFGPSSRFEITGVPVAPYSPNAWHYWEGLRRCVEVADSWAVHLYPGNLDELRGDWSLPWWLGQLPPGTPIRVTECGARPGTDAATRLQVIPALLRQIRACPQVRSEHVYITSTEREHEEHHYTEPLVDAMCAVLREPVETAPPPAEPPPGTVPVPPGTFTPSPPPVAYDWQEHAAIIRALAERIRKRHERIATEQSGIDSDAQEIVDRVAMLRGQ